MLLNLHKQYQYSAKALIELQMLAEAMAEKMLKPVNLKGTLSVKGHLMDAPLKQLLGCSFATVLGVCQSL